jgi:hypothetical protein
MSPDPAGDSFEHQPLDALVRIGHDLAARARRLDAEYVCAHMPAREGRLVFTCKRGSVWVTGAGFDVELSALPKWQRWRPPGY